MKVTTWDIDTDHSSITFWIRHLVIGRVRGRFERWRGTLEMPDMELSSGYVHVEIDAATIYTGNRQRDAHLRSADFLDAETYPTITFESHQVEDLGGNRLSIMGNLTMRGAEHPVELEAYYTGQAEGPDGTSRIGFFAKTAIDRRDFGVSWNRTLEAGGALIGDTIHFELDVEGVRRDG